MEIQSRYYTVKQIQQLECCGRDEAYKIANSLPHENRGKKIYVFSEDYNNYYQEKRNKALAEKGITNEIKTNIYQIRKFN